MKSVHSAVCGLYKWADVYSTGNQQHWGVVFQPQPALLKTVIQDGYSLHELINWTLFSNDYETLIIFYFFPFIFSTKLLFVMGFKSSTDLLLTAAYFLYFLKALTLFSSAQYKKDKLVNKIQLVQVPVWKCLFGGTWRRLVNIHLPNTFFDSDVIC